MLFSAKLRLDIMVIIVLIPPPLFIYSGKAYKRGLEYHITTSLAVTMLQFDAVLSTKDPVRIQCIALKDKLHERNPEMVESFEKLQSWYAGNIKPLEDAEGIGEFAQFPTQYLGQVEGLLQLISCYQLSDSRFLSLYVVFWWFMRALARQMATR